MYHLFGGWDTFGIRDIFSNYRGSFPTLEEAKSIAEENSAAWAEVIYQNDEGRLQLASALSQRVPHYQWTDK